MSPASTPGEEALVRLLEQSPVKIVDNRCFCLGAYGVGIPHVKGVPRGCDSYRPVPTDLVIQDAT